MRLWIAIVDRKTPAGPAAQLLQEYVARSTRYLPCELHIAPTEPRLLEALDRAAGRTRPVLILADSSGALLTSTEFAAELTRCVDSGTQLFVLATECQKRRSLLGRKLQGCVKQRLDSLPVLRV